MVDRLEFEYGYIEIRDVKYHRGIIPLPRGTIYLEKSLSIDQIYKVFYDFFKQLGLSADDRFIKEYISWLLSYLNVNINAVRFYTSYTEFLYPGSPGLGYNLEIDYVDEVEKEDIQDWLDKLFKDIVDGIEFGKLPFRKHPDLILENFESFLDDEEKYIELVDNLYDAVNSYVRELNSYIYAAEETIYDYVEKLKSEYEEYEEPEEPEPMESEYEEE